MRNFLARFALFFAVIYALMLCIAFFVRDEMTPLTYMSGLKAKFSRLKNLQCPKIVFVGGSNLAYGMNSAYIEKEMGREVVNMAIHAGLGLKYQLSSVLPYVCQGDCVVVSPEYSQFQSSVFWGEQDLVEAIAESAPESMVTLDGRQLIHFLTFVPGYSAKKMFRLFKFWRKKAYRGAAFNWKWNEQGDLIGHWVLPAPNRTFDLSSANDDMIFDEATFSFVREFTDEVGRRGAKVVVMPPCFWAGYFDAMPNAIRRVSDGLARCGVPFAVPPARYRMPSAMMYDTVYHLNKQGVDERTARMLEDLKGVIGGRRTQTLEKKSEL